MSSATATTYYSKLQKARSSQRWYVAQVQPRKEQLALRHLRRQYFTVYCPLINLTKRVRNRSVSRAEPLFPGYVFVALDCERDRWRSVNGTIGVLRLVSFGTRPAATPRGFVEHLQKLTRRENTVEFEGSLMPGDEVRIVGGAFDGMCGLLASNHGLERVTVLLQMLSGERKVTMPRSNLIATE